MRATADYSSSSDDDYSDNSDDEGDTSCFGGRQVFLEPTVAFTPVHVPSRLSGRRPLLTTDDALELCRNLENLYIGDKDDGNKKKKKAEDRNIMEKGDDDVHKSYASNKRYPTLESIFFEDDCDENEIEEEIQTMGSKSKRSRPRETKKTVTTNKRCNFLNNDDDDPDGDNQEDEETGSPTVGLFTQRVRDPQTRRIVKVKRSARLSASPST